MSGRSRSHRKGQRESPLCLGTACLLTTANKKHVFINPVLIIICLPVSFSDTRYQILVIFVHRSIPKPAHAMYAIVFYINILQTKETLDIPYYSWVKHHYRVISEVRWEWRMTLLSNKDKACRKSSPCQRSRPAKIKVYLIFKQHQTIISRRIIENITITINIINIIIIITSIIMMIIIIVTISRY